MRNHVTLSGEREREREERKVEKYDCSRRNVERSYLRKQYLFTTLFPYRSEDLSFQTINYFHRSYGIYEIQYLSSEMKNYFRRRRLRSTDRH